MSEPERAVQPPLQGAGEIPTPGREVRHPRHGRPDHLRLPRVSRQDPDAAPERTGRPLRKRSDVHTLTQVNSIGRSTCRTDQNVGLLLFLPHRRHRNSDDEQISDIGVHPTAAESRRGQTGAPVRQAHVPQPRGRRRHGPGVPLRGREYG